MSEDLDSLIKDVANADRLPEAALRALVAHAPALTARLTTIARRRVEGEWLYPEEENLLFYGLFVLAATRAHVFWPIWFELLTSSDDGLDGLFGDGAIMSVCGITLGLVGDDVETIADLVARVDLGGDMRAGLMQALARLTCEGRYPREKFVALIDVLATLEGAEEDDRCKWCVEEAIVLAGVAERAELLEQIWRTEAFSIWNDADKAAARERLAAASARPADLTRFDEDGIAAPVNPVDGLRWLKAIEAHAREPAGGDALSWREREWLAALLLGPTAPDETMCFEELDGFFHALVIGPDLVMPSEYLPEIWGEGPEFQHEAQLRKVMGLLQRHWNAIARRNVAPHTPPAMWLEPHDNTPPGAMWASGFARGVALRSQAWQGVAEDEAASMALECILQIKSDDIEPWERTELLHMLGEHFIYLADFWQDQRAPREPTRSKKVGRNEPCPCGSGKKWKKCCGAGPPPVLH